MTDVSAMVERAARAVTVAEGRNPDDPAYVRYPGAYAEGTAWKERVKKACAALLAALDPEDEALMVAMAKAIAAYGTSHFGDDRPLEQQDTLVQAMRRGEARAALLVLKAAAQGEQS